MNQKKTRMPQLDENELFVFEIAIEAKSGFTVYTLTIGFNCLFLTICKHL